MLSGNYDMGLGRLGGIRVGGDRGVAGFSPRPIYTRYHDYDNTRAPPRPLPRPLLGNLKRSAPKADLSPPSPSISKHIPIPIHSPLAPAAVRSFPPMQNHLPPELCDIYHVDSINRLFEPLALTPEVVLTFQEKYEGDLVWDGVSPEDVGRWETQHPEVIEHDEIRYEYNVLNRHFIIKCSPTPTHESFSQFFSSTLVSSLSELGGQDFVDKVRIGGSGMGM